MHTETTMLFSLALHNWLVGSGIRLQRTIFSSFLNAEARGTDVKEDTGMLVEVYNIENVMGRTRMSQYQLTTSCPATRE